jgi:NAD dependent epimerase/dehydratase family enzyme
VVVLEGQKVVPQQTLNSGFNYEYETLDRALAQILTTG